MSIVRTPEQQMLGDSLRRFLSETFDFDARMRVIGSENGRSPATWQGLAALGVTGLPFAEGDGGYGGTAADVAVVMEEAGRALLTEPVLAGLVETAALIAHAPEAARARLVPAVVDGSLILPLAHGEPQARWSLTDVETRAVHTAGGWVLTGRKSAVACPASADGFIVSARVSGGRQEAAGIALFHVDRASAGLSTAEYAAFDGTRAGEVTLADVAVAEEDCLCGPEAGARALSAAREAAIAALAAEAVGAMGVAVEMTTEYLKTRKQFGVAIGSFQALQHRAAEMYVALELSRSMAVLAAAALDSGAGEERARTLSAVKLQVARSARFIGQQAVQLHGGIGMTAEYRIGHLFKRLTMIDKQHGDADWHLEALAAGPSLLEPV